MSGHEGGCSKEAEAGDSSGNGSHFSPTVISIISVVAVCAAVLGVWYCCRRKRLQRGAATTGSTQGAELTDTTGNTGPQYSLLT